MRPAQHWESWSRVIAGGCNPCQCPRQASCMGLQVVHHPTVLAAYGEGRKWTFEGDAEVKSKFWGRSIELTPVGVLKLTFHDGEVFTWSKVC